jgi:hypothetical protein
MASRPSDAALFLVAVSFSQLQGIFNKLSFYIRERVLSWFYVGWSNGNAMHWCGNIFCVNIILLKAISTKCHSILERRGCVGFMLAGQMVMQCIGVATFFDAASVSQLKGVSTKIHFQLRGRRQVGFFVTWPNGK